MKISRNNKGVELVATFPSENKYLSDFYGNRWSVGPNEFSSNPSGKYTEITFIDSKGLPMLSLFKEIQVKISIWYVHECLRKGYKLIDFTDENIPLIIEEYQCKMSSEQNVSGPIRPRTDPGFDVVPTSGVNGTEFKRVQHKKL